MEKIKLFEDFNLNESVEDTLAKEVGGTVYDAYTEDRETVKAHVTTKTWDDGTPVLKDISRSSQVSVKLPKSFKVIEDNEYGWWYFKIGKKWYGMKQSEYDNYPPFEM